MQQEVQALSSVYQINANKLGSDVIYLDLPNIFSTLKYLGNFQKYMFVI